MKFSDSIVFKILFYCFTQVRVFDIRSKKELKKNLIRGSYKQTKKSIGERVCRFLVRLRFTSF